MRLRTFVFLALGAFTIASAQGPVQSASGRGVAQNANSIRGRFDFEVTKRRVEGQVVLRGRLAWRSEVPRENFVAEVNLGTVRVEEYTNTKVCEFGGSGVLVRRRANGTVRNEGRIACRVQDRRAEGVGEPDTFRIQFFSPTNVLLYSFDGRVVEGNILVRLQ